MKNVVRVVSGLTLLCITWAGIAHAEVPTVMNVQGRLKDASGTVVTAGVRDFTFRIFDLPVGGVEVWPVAIPLEQHSLMVDGDGLWNASIGTIRTLIPSVFESSERWLEITVQEGAAPPETLSRILLQSNPYTYSAASSQNVVIYPSGSINPTRNVISHSPSFPTWGLQYQDTSDVMNFVSNGTPVLSIDLGAPSVVMPGNTDSIRFNAFATGNIAVELPDNSISNVELLNEPGVAQGINTGTVSLTTDGVTVPVATRTITCPAAGYILAIASAHVTFEKKLYIHSSMATSILSFIASSQKIFSAVAGPNALYVLARKDFGANAPDVSDITLSLLYVPTSYGTVSAVVSASEAENFESAEMTTVRHRNDDGSYSEQVLYEVDLRELEVRAARKEAEAERARRQLLEARMSTGRQEVVVTPWAQDQP